MSNTKKRNPVILVILLLAAAALLAAVVIGLSKPVQSEEPLPLTSETFLETTTTTAPTVTVPPTEPAIILECINGEIQTPYLTLQYSDAMTDHLVVANTSDDPYTVAFYAAMAEKPEVRLFDILLAKELETKLGMVETFSGTMAIGLTIYDLPLDSSWNKDEINTVYAMQDMANNMLELLPITQENIGDSPAISNAPPTQNTVNFINIETPYCVLNYPVSLAKNMRVEQVESDDVLRVQFYGQLPDREKILLFSILLGGDEGEQMGVISGDDGLFLTVNLLMESLELDGWQEEELEELYAMQEGANILLERIPMTVFN